MKIYCKQCGAENEGVASLCDLCGYVFSPEKTMPKERIYIENSRSNSIPSYLVQSILCTIFCFLPFGVVALVNAAQVKTKIQAGELESASESSRKAKMWCWWSLGTGILVGVFGILLKLILVQLMIAS